MLVPLHGFAPGDTLGVLVLARSDDTIAVLAASLAEAVAVRRGFSGELRVRKGNTILPSSQTVAAAGLSALDRIDNGTYGYCEETGDEIGLRRLEARPVATLCVEAQERRELAEKQFTDREDYYR